MEPRIAPASPPVTTAAAPFRHIVCGVDGSRAGYQAVRQAGALAGPESRISLVAVAYEWGEGLNAGALLSVRRADDALDRASDRVAHCPARIDVVRLWGKPASESLVDEAVSAGGDLIVVGRHGFPRFEGAAIGSTATSLAHRSPLPVLLASRPPHGVTFPQNIIVAADGPGRPEEAIRAATRIAAFSGSRVTVARFDWSRRMKRPEIAAAVAELAAVTGVEPVEVLAPGDPVRGIVELAAREAASLVIAGSRGVGGLRAIRSVSERLAHQAPCSLLIVRQASSG